MSVRNYEVDVFDYDFECPANQSRAPLGAVTQPQISKR